VKFAEVPLRNAVTSQAMASLFDSSARDKSASLIRWRSLRPPVGYLRPLYLLVPAQTAARRRPAPAPTQVHRPSAYLHLDIWRQLRQSLQFSFLLI
jgi:hypothetical protein